MNYVIKLSFFVTSYLNGNTNFQTCNLTWNVSCRQIGKYRNVFEKHLSENIIKKNRNFSLFDLLNPKIKIYVSFYFNLKLNFSENYHLIFFVNIWQKKKIYFVITTLLFKLLLRIYFDIYIYICSRDFKSYLFILIRFKFKTSFFLVE